MITTLLILALQQGGTPSLDVQALADSYCYSLEEIQDKLEESLGEMVFICPPDGLYVIDLDCHQDCLNAFIAQHYQNYTNLCDQAQEIAEKYRIEESIIDATYDECLPHCWARYERELNRLLSETVANLKDLSNFENLRDHANQWEMTECMKDCCIRIDILAALGKEALSVGVPLPGIDLVELSLFSQGVN